MVCDDTIAEINISKKIIAEDLALQRKKMKVSKSDRKFRKKNASSILNDGDHITLLDFEQSEGQEVFWHTSAHVLAQAVSHLYPNAKPTIGPPIENGFYYDLDLEKSLTQEDIDALEKRMRI